jgi:hypothetical protein
MPVGSEANIMFSVYDSRTPPNAKHETRTLRIVSPCPPGAVHCPKLTQPCGTSSCTVRSAILEMDQALETEPTFTLLFHPSIAGLVVSRPGTGPSLNASWPCSARPPLDLSICENDSSTCFVHAGSSTLAGLRLRVWSPASSSSDITGICSVSALSSGTCPIGNHAVKFQMFLSDREISDQATLNVSISNPILSFAINTSVQLSVSGTGSISATSQEDLKELLSGSSSLTNRLLQDASVAIKAAIHASPYHFAADSIYVDLRATNAALVTQPSEVTLKVCSV